MLTLSNILSELNSALHSFLLGPVMLTAFIGVGLYFNIRTGFFPITKIKFWLSKTLLALFRKKSRTASGKALSSFEALFAALAGSMGTGNITGVATAIVFGGPGAIFWMWVSAFLGMMTKYAENVLGMLFREKKADGSGYYGSPMLYMEKGLHCRPLAIMFASCCVLASFGLGNMTQGNSVATALEASLFIPPIYCGIALAIIVAIVIMGGLKRIGTLTSYLIPIVSVVYLICAVIILIVNADTLPAVFALIFKEAFRLSSVGGGVLGYGIKKALETGISRGVFSNEAGLGSSVMVYSSSESASPSEQGMWGIFEVFLDTIIICTLTALVILCSGVYDINLYEDALINGYTSLPNGSVLASNAFASVFGSFGPYFISISMALYAFATLLTWSHYGSISCEYLFGKKSIPYYNILFLIFIIIGCIVKLEVIWNIADTLNCLLAIPNLIALILLSGKVIKTVRDI
ncbi:MAG: sodium:alanine symporter family protein [Lachnospiraceae bacterium]|nr:sodium:alanine symporter family protein [Lachnospiraceae bacterium]